MFGSGREKYNIADSKSELVEGKSESIVGKTSLQNIEEQVHAYSMAFDHATNAMNLRAILLSM
jgi:hypothetical protein